MRIVLLGSPQCVVPTFEYIVKNAASHGHEVVAIVSQPAKEAGRGKKFLQPPVAEFAINFHIPLFQPQRASNAEFLDQLRKLEPDLMITAAYGQILTEDFLKIPKRGTINIHPSLLPKYRGAVPVPAALLNGDSETGVSILFTVKKLDAGNIILQKSYPIENNEKANELLDRLFIKSHDLIFEAINKLKDESFIGIPQDENLVTHCKKISKEDGEVDWNTTNSMIFNKFRGLFPWPGCFTFLNGKRVNLEHLETTENCFSLSKNGQFNYIKTEKKIAVKCSQGSILVSQLKSEGGKSIDASSFWNGLKDKENLNFG